MGDDTGHDTTALPVSWSAARAARETGSARSTILAALQSGRLEGSKDADGHWQITPQALAVAGFTPGKPSPPEDTQPLEVDRDDDAARLRLELAEARADARVAVVERDAERRLREAVERERDLYRRMLEAPPVPATDRPQTPPQPAPDHVPTPPLTGRWRRVWNLVRHG